MSDSWMVAAGRKARADRAEARVISAEMHSGFTALRRGVADELSQAGGAAT